MSKIITDKELGVMVNLAISHSLIDDVDQYRDLK